MDQEIGYWLQGHLDGFGKGISALKNLLKKHGVDTGDLDEAIYALNRAHTKVFVKMSKKEGTPHGPG